MSMFTSHAQNFEDVILWRALKEVRRGVYVDVGAQDPALESVSLGFYEQGWRGVHVEANPHFADELRRARPDETVIEAAAGTDPGPVEFFEVPGTGLSTGDMEIARHHEAEGRIVRRLEVPCVTLDAVMAPLAGGDIHWLKVDVEGMEAAVLESWRSDVRPWIVVVEATEVNSQTTSYETWDPGLLARGYGFVYFDGLNRFYVSEHHPELARHFGPGPNVFDGFVVSRNAAAAGGLNAEIADFRARTADLETQRDVLRAETDRHRREADTLSLRLAATEASARETSDLLDAFLGSTSWRITAPLRHAARTAAHVRDGARAWSRVAQGSRPHRVAVGATTRAETAIRSNPRLTALARRLVPGFGAKLLRARASANATTRFDPGKHPLRSRLIAALEAEIARESPR
jgi:FkbM family methyltransferase